MASGRLTNKLTYEIETNARKAWEKANKEPELSLETQKEIIETIKDFPVQKALKKVYDEQSKYTSIIADSDRSEFEVQEKEITSIRMYLVNENGPGRSFKVEFDPPVPFCAYFTYARYTNTYNVFEQYFENEVLRKKIKNEVQNYLNQKETYQINRNQFLDEIRKATRNCTTVHGLLEVEPAFEQWIPTEAKEKMNVKITRAKKAQMIKEDFNLDSTNIKKVALISKIVGA